MVTRVHRELSDEDVLLIAGTYHAWRDGEFSAYTDTPGFCRSVGVEELARARFIVTPARHVGSGESGADPEEVAQRIKALIGNLEAEEGATARLGDALAKALRRTLV